MPVEFKYTTEEFEYTVTVYEEETEYYETGEQDEDPVEDFSSVTCPICRRTFASPGNMKQHRTVKEH